MSEGDGVIVRDAEARDHGQMWALNSLPFEGRTADPTVPLPLAPHDEPPAGFPDLADVQTSFQQAGGHFLVAELAEPAEPAGPAGLAEVDGAVVGMAGIRPSATHQGRADVLRVRVHPATRRRGVGRALMDELEARARVDGHRELFLDTTPEQPEAIAFYEALGYREVGREARAEWTWTLIFFAKDLWHDRGS